MTPDSHNRPASPALVAELTEAMRREAGVVRELRDALVNQRAGVGNSDPAIVNDSVDAIERILLTLSEARMRRHALLQSLERGAPQSAPPSSPALDAARAELRRAATEVARETSINQAVLRRAVENGEAFLQALFSSVVDPPAVYAPTERPAEPGAAGVLLNRKA